MEKIPGLEPLLLILNVSLANSGSKVISIQATFLKPKNYAFGLPDTDEEVTGADGKAGISIKGIGGEVQGNNISK